MRNTGRRLTPQERVSLRVSLYNGASTDEAAALFRCSPSTVKLYARHLRIDGKLDNRPVGDVPLNRRKLHPWALDVLLEELEYHNDLYLDEMQWFLVEQCDIHVDITTISRQLKKANWSTKAIKTQALQATNFQRDLYTYNTLNFTSEQFVFVDESGVAQRDSRRRRGWAPKGHTPWQSKLLKQGTRFNILPALTIDGFLTSFVYVGLTDLEGFTLWLKNSVLPRMNPFPGRHSVLVMDNASFHHSAEIYQLCDEAGVKLQYLPPYSPDFNPIEAMFGHLKKHMRRQARWRNTEFASDTEFGYFLEDCLEEVGRDKEQIRGFFKHAGAGKDLGH